MLFATWDCKGENTGLHFDAYPPEFDPETNPALAFWITGGSGDTDE